MISGLIFLFWGKPSSILILTGALNGLVLPITLGIILVASQRQEIVGEYNHPKWLLILGVLVAIFMAYAGISSLSSIGQLF